MKLALVTLLCASTLSLTVSAAIPAKKAAPAPGKILSEAGAVAGGLAGSGFSLTNVTLSKTPGKERLVIDLGDLNGAPIKGYPAYYHAEMQKNPHRLVIDFAQTPNAMVNEKTINDRLKASNKIQSTTILIDPTDQTLSLILELKKDARAQVFQVPGQKGTGRVVVDLL